MRHRVLGWLDWLGPLVLELLALPMLDIPCWAFPMAVKDFFSSKTCMQILRLLSIQSNDHSNPPTTINAQI